MKLSDLNQPPAVVTLNFVLVPNCDPDIQAMAIIDKVFDQILTAKDCEVLDRRAQVERVAAFVALKYGVKK